MRLVVGAAILRAGRVLAARRTRPVAMAGRWEFPGGKVEPGEEADAALIRELGEELGVTVRVTEWLGPRVRVDDEHVLAVALARLVDGEPVATEHDDLRWLGAEELDTVPWADADLPFLAQVAAALEPPMLRAVLFDQEDAEAVRRRLDREGWTAHLVRERLAGEDDEEDHPWAVLTDAPAITVELLIEEYDGWLDPGDAPTDRTDDLTGDRSVDRSGDAAGEPARSAPAPLDLPEAPRRIKRPHG